MKSSNLVRSALLVSSFGLACQSANALVIGHFDNTRESWGMSTGYISGARQWLLDNGHTLVPTNHVSSAYLSGVDAFYTGLIITISGAEIDAMQNFVDVEGGFLFIQQDHDSGSWHPPSSQILSNWGIVNSAGTFANDAGHTTVGSSSWVRNPNNVTAFSGAVHSSINIIPDGFETIAVDNLGRVLMGAFDAGAGRSSDVFVATDIDFWSDYVGWNDLRNRQLWENIWTTASVQIDPPAQQVSEPGSIALLGIGLSLLGLLRYRSATSQ